MHTYTHTGKYREMQHHTDSPICYIYTVQQKYKCLTWSQSPSSMVPLIFLKNSVNWPPFFLSASDAATPAYISTAGGDKKMVFVTVTISWIKKEKFPAYTMQLLPGRPNWYIIWKAKSKFFSTRVSAILHLLLQSDTAKKFLYLLHMS